MHFQWESWRGLLMALPDAVLVATTTGQIMIANDQAERLFGLSRAELQERSLDEILCSISSSDYSAGCSRFPLDPPILDGGAPIEASAVVGTQGHLAVEVSLGTSTTDEEVFFVAVVRDVSSARRSERQLRRVLASVPDAILGVDATGRIELVNAQAERMFGWANEDLVGQPITVLMPEASRERHLGHQAAYVTHPMTRAMGSRLEVLAMRKNGESFPADVSLNHVDGDGSLAVLATVRDASERVKLEAERKFQALEEQREQTNRLEVLGRLAGGDVHDFNNLLGVILNYGALLRRRVTDPGDAADLEKICSAAKSAAEITSQLLTIGRRGSSGTRPIEINAIVADMVSVLAGTFDKGIEVALDLASNPLVAFVDRAHLEQIILNLLINARDAMPSGGHLKVRTACSAPPSSSEASVAEEMDAVLEVSDDGMGMKPEVLTHVFEPFFTTKKPGEGTGLGLATVYGMVQRNGGQIAIDSSPGAGTTVSIRLKGNEDNRWAQEEELSKVPGGDERILVVSSEVDRRFGTAQILIDHGYEVVTAVDESDALDVLADDHHGFELVVLDGVTTSSVAGAITRSIKTIRPGLGVVVASDASDHRSDAPEALGSNISRAGALRLVRGSLDGEDEPPIGVLVVDDQRLFAESVARLLSQEDGIVVLGIAIDGIEALTFCDLRRPDVILLDLHMPGEDGLSVAAQIKELHPEITIVMLTGSADPAVLPAAFEAGCSGFLTKDRDVSEVAAAVRSAAAGELVIPPDLIPNLLRRRTGAPPGIGSDLTEREHELLVLIAQGKSGKAIASELNLSVNTIRNYTQAILTKLDAHSKLEAVSIAMREGIIIFGSLGLPA